MNKQDLVSAVADQCGMSKADVGKVVDATLDTIGKALKKNDDVRLVGFGTYTVTQRSETEGRNPRTGETIKIPARKQIKFRAGKKLSEEIN